MFSMLHTPLLLLSSVVAMLATHTDRNEVRRSIPNVPVATRIVEFKASNSGVDEITIDLQKMWCVPAASVGARIHPDRPIRDWVLPPRMDGAIIRIEFPIGESDLKECLGLAAFTKSRTTNVNFVIPLSAPAGTPPKQIANLGDVHLRLKR
jgi:hypothetical protein